MARGKKDRGVAGILTPVVAGIEAAQDARRPEIAGSPPAAPVVPPANLGTDNATTWPAQEWRPLEEALQDPLSPVSVRNDGTAPWCGSDYADVGSGYIPAGTMGVVTLRKARELVADYGPEGKRGVGPFVIVSASIRMGEG